MLSANPIRRGVIDAETARRAATLLEEGKTTDLELFPFNEVAIDANAQEILDVKKEVEKVC